jgi:hydroxypyruvate reductase
VADGASLTRARERGEDLRARLARNDSNPVLAALGDLVVTGPTHTNLLDLYLLLIEPR